MVVRARQVGQFASPVLAISGRPAAPRMRRLPSITLALGLALAASTLADAHDNSNTIFDRGAPVGFGLLYAGGEDGAQNAESDTYVETLLRILRQDAVAARATRR
jgi:hypothetical protein